MHTLVTTAETGIEKEILAGFEKNAAGNLRNIETAIQCGNTRYQ